MLIVRRILTPLISTALALFILAQPSAATVEYQLVISVEPANITALPGNTMAAVVRVAAVPEARVPVRFNVSGQPPGTLAVISPIQGTTPMMSQLQVQVGKSTPPGTYPMAIMAADMVGTLVTASLTLNVVQDSQPPQQPPPQPPQQQWQPPLTLTFEGLNCPPASVPVGEPFTVLGSTRHHAPSATEVRLLSFIDDRPLQTASAIVAGQGSGPFRIGPLVEYAPGPHTLTTVLEYFDRNRQSWVQADKAGCLFTIVSPIFPLAVTSVSPTSGAQGDTLELTISGENFPDGVKVTFDGPPGITIGQLQASRTELKLTIVVARDAPAGPKDIVVVNPDGQTGSLKGGFTVTAATPAADITPPPPITGLTARDAKDGKIDLAWSPSPIPDFAYYAIYSTQKGARTTSVGGLTPLAKITDRAATRYQLTGLQNGVEHYFAVTAVDKTGNEEKVVSSASASATPSRPVPVFTPDFLVKRQPDIPFEVAALLIFLYLMWGAYYKKKMAGTPHFHQIDVTRKPK